MKTCHFSNLNNRICEVASLIYLFYSFFNLFPVCRALGIPCRTVTNFNSNHDSDDNLSVNVYLGEDEKGNIFEQKEGNVWLVDVNVKSLYGL